MFVGRQTLQVLVERAALSHIPMHLVHFQALQGTITVAQKQFSPALRAVSLRLVELQALYA
jgi:hypothetical protein